MYYECLLHKCVGHVDTVFRGIRGGIRFGCSAGSRATKPDINVRGIFHSNVVNLKFESPAILTS